MKVTFGSYPKLLIKDQDKLLIWLNVANVKALTNEKMRFKTWLRKISVAEPEPKLICRNYVLISNLCTPKPKQCFLEGFIQSTIATHF